MLTSSSTKDLYEQYKSTLQKIADVKYASAVLQWDQETYLPPLGADKRGKQLATLSEVSHKMSTNNKLGNLLEELSGRGNLSFVEKQNIATSFEEYKKVRKFSAKFVRTMSETVSASFHAWVEARKKNSFQYFEPFLQTIVELKKQEAHIIGFEAHPYNALMNEFEKGATVQIMDKVFDDVIPSLSTLLEEVQKFPLPDDRFLYRNIPKQEQWEFGMYIATCLGFDFKAGRQDVSEHPFTINFSSRDVRITTRIEEMDFSNMLWSTIHEVGHALYEQGLPDSEYGFPSGEYTSLGIHESQSRLWENCVGRGTAFWKYFLPKLNEFYKGKMDDVSLDNFLQAVNKVQPSLIRTEADELTYHFHVKIRYEIEKLLVSGELTVKNIPVFWNEQYKKLLTVEVPDDIRGCLQDVHWSHGSFGYFATYSLGSFYAAQFWEQAKTDIPQLETQIETAGNTSPLLVWLQSSIHTHGKSFTSNQLCSRVTGRELDSKIFVKYLRSKLNRIFL